MIPPGDGHHRPKRSLGQNFLIDPNLQRKIVEALDPQPSDDVLEIGPGRGALTRHLVGRVRRLVLVELDRELARRLADEFAHDPSVTVLERDILTVDLAEVAADPGALKVIGNIPYNITSPILFHLLEPETRPREIVVMIQREVAERITAEPGGRSYGALAVGVRSVARVEIVLHVGRKAFRPVPDVDSTVLRIRPLSPPPLDAATEAALRSLTRLAFGQRRKQMQKVLRDALAITPADVERIQAAAGLDLKRRPETFGPDDFIRLTRVLMSAGHL